jgi:FkbM family methyltransferase
VNIVEADHYYLESYAENREDLYIRAIFGETYRGFYIDVGANHPIHHSVTKMLYRDGWHGINVEPIEELVALLAYDRQRDTQLCYGVGRIRGKGSLRKYDNEGLSTLSVAMQRDYAKQSSDFTDTYEDITIEVRTLKDICTEYKVTKLDLLKVDVEGYEKEVLEGNDWKRFRPKVICIEANHIVNDWANYILKQGYVKKLSDGLNDYYVDAGCKLADTPVHFAETVLRFPHVVDNDVASYIAVQKLRAESAAIVARAMRQPGRKASIRLLKETVRLAMDEMKFLVKESNKQPRGMYIPPSTIQAPSSLKGLMQYVEAVNSVYDHSFASIRQYELAQSPKSRTAGMVRRAKLAGYDTPRFILGEARKVARRRMK